MDTKKILNITALALALIGVIFKANHFPGANICICLSGATMLVSLIMFGIKDNKEAGLADWLNYFLTGTLALYIVGIVFKFQHWPGAGLFVLTCYPLAFIFPLILIFQGGDFKVSKQFIISFFIYFILLISLFPNNPVQRFFGGNGENTMNQNGTEMNGDSLEHK